MCYLPLRALVAKGLLSQIGRGRSDFPYPDPARRCIDCGIFSNGPYWLGPSAIGGLMPAASAVSICILSKCITGQWSVEGDTYTTLSGCNEQNSNISGKRVFGCPGRIGTGHQALSRIGRIAHGGPGCKLAVVTVSRSKISNSPCGMPCPNLTICGTLTQCPVGSCAVSCPSAFDCAPSNTAAFQSARTCLRLISSRPAAVSCSHSRLS